LRGLSARCSASASMTFSSRRCDFSRWSTSTACTLTYRSSRRTA
jgi:hypothetical protein